MLLGDCCGNGVGLEGRVGGGEQWRWFGSGVVGHDLIDLAEFRDLMFAIRNIVWNWTRVFYLGLKCFISALFWLNQDAIV